MASALARRRPLPKPSPESDPRFRKVMEQLKAGASKTKAHPPASKKAAEAAGAAKGPPNERGAAGKAKQVDKIKEAPAKKPEPSSFLDLLRAEIAKAMPKTLADTEKFDDKAQQMKGGLKNSATQQKNEAAGPVAGASRQTPGQEGEAKQETPIPPEGAPAPMNVAAGEGMPAPKSDADVSLQDSKQETDQQMKDAEVTPTQLQKANDPRFSAVLDAKGQVARQADAAPAQYRGSERATLAGAAASAQNTTRQSAAAMIGVRRGSGTRVLTRQQQQRARDEAKRRDVVASIEKIYNDTKVRVEAKLSSLDTEVATMFDQGTEAALNAMTTFVNARIREYKIDRYLSIPFVGAARWIRDQFRGLPSEANVFYEQGRERFRASMDALIVRVANLVEKRLKEAKDEVARGQAAIKTYVNSLGPELRNIGQQAQRDVAGRFEELTRSIDDKKNQLAQGLAAKYKEAFDKANEALKKIQDENKGLVAGFIGKLLEVIRAILEFKDKLMSILRKGAAAIKLIIADPIGFLSNLIAAVAGGINQFVKNIKRHMVEGFKQWLFGSMGGMGIEVPPDLSLPSILKLVLSVLGVTFDKMRAKAVRLIGERNVQLVLKLVDYIRTLITGGPTALWEMVKEDLATLKEMVIDAIKNYVMETAMKRGMAKIVLMFNPVGAIIGAIMAIYDIVMFVVEKAKQIMAFVESVVNSIYDIASGNISGAIAKVEESLAKAIPLLIGFLAQFAGLGKVTEKIQEFIKKIQDKVDAAIDKGIAKIVALVKRMFGGGATARPDNRTPAQQEADLARAAAEASQLQNRPGIKVEQVRAGLPALRTRYNLSSAELEHGEGEKYHINLVINPKRKTEDKEYKAKYKLLPGTFEQHEGMEIVPGQAQGGTVHLLTLHGARVPNEVLIGRLQDLRTRYEQARARQRALLDAQLLNLQAQHDAAPNNQKAGFRSQIETASRQRRALDSLNLNNATEIIQQMRKWHERDIPPMATRWRSPATMRNVIQKAITDNAEKIDNDFTANPAAGARSVHEVTSDEWAGEGFKFAGNAEIVRIDRSLHKATVVLRLQDVNKKLFVVQTAYPEP
jgi:hypothetical protein